MNLFYRLYKSVLSWAAHQHADRYLAAMAFAEASFFPIPVETLLVPMTLATPKKYKYFTLVAAIASVLGGVLGYMIGYYLIDAIHPYLIRFGYLNRYQTVLSWFDQWGFWVVFLAGISPLPYKLVTIAAGALGFSLLPFFAASLVGRTARFFIVATVVAKIGPALAPVILKYIEWIGWVLVALIVVLVIWAVTG